MLDNLNTTLSLYCFLLIFIVTELCPSVSFAVVVYD